MLRSPITPRSRNGDAASIGNLGYWKLAASRFELPPGFNSPRAAGLGASYSSFHGLRYS